MSRNKPEILLEHINKTTYKSEQILAAEGIYAVFYEGKPINIKNVSTYFSLPAPRYKKSSFQNPGFAINLCRKLNKKYRCASFTVVELIKGEQIFPAI